METLEKLIRTIERLEEVPGHPNLKKETGLRILLKYIQENYVPKDELMSEIRDQLRNNPQILRDALGDTRYILNGTVDPIVVDTPTEIPADRIIGRTWALMGRPDGFSTNVDIPGRFEWIGFPSFGRSDILRTLFLPNDGVHFAPTIFEVHYIIEDKENMNPNEFERVIPHIEGWIETDKFPVDIHRMEATVGVQEKISLGCGYQIRGRYLKENEGHWEWAPEADTNTPGVKRVIYKPNDPKFKAVSTLVRVVDRRHKK